MKSNQNTFFLFFILLLILTGCSDNGSSIPEEESSNNNSALETKVHNLINDYRNAQDLPSLELHDVISETAREHSQNMANGETPFGHDGFSERVGKIREQIGGNGAAENVALGYNSAESVVEGWINSSGHRKNIEGSYTLTGIGIAYSEEGQPYYTQIFLKK